MPRGHGWDCLLWARLHLSAFDRLQRIGGTLLLRNIYGLEDLGGFDALREVGSVEINEIARETSLEAEIPVGEDRLRSVSGFNALIEIPGSLTLEHTDIRDVTGFHIGGNLDLYQLGADGTLGLTSLETIGGYAHINDPNGVVDVGLPALQEVGGQLLLGGLNEITSLDGIASLRRVDGDLRIVDNRNLSSADARAWAENVEVAGDVIICANQPPDDDCSDLLGD